MVKIGVKQLLPLEKYIKHIQQHTVLYVFNKILSERTDKTSIFYL